VFLVFNYYSTPKGVVTGSAEAEATFAKHLRKKNLCVFTKFNLPLRLENESIFKKIHLNNSIY
jgi:hypothetical protein